jgi:osmoprotectant transport system ATP-binding protein
MFELIGVRKSYGGALALGPIDLRVPPGRTVVLIGPSGCGKSTLIRLMIGLVRPDAGRILFQGAEVDPLRAPQMRRRMGYVVQGGGLFPHLTAAENASLLARYLGWKETQIGERLAQLAELTRFPKEGLSRYPAQLSGGQSQRVSLMRALMLEPDVLLLDEPLGALDPITRFDLQADLRLIFERVNKTVVLVTHDLPEAAFFAHRIVLLRAGGIIQEGTLEQLARSPADPFVTRFIQAQRMSLLEAKAP